MTCHCRIVESRYGSLKVPCNAIDMRRGRGKKRKNRTRVSLCPLLTIVPILNIPVVKMYIYSIPTLPNTFSTQPHPVLHCYYIGPGDLKQSTKLPYLPRRSLPPSPSCRPAEALLTGSYLSTDKNDGL